MGSAEAILKWRQCWTSLSTEKPILNNFFSGGHTAFVPNKEYDLQKNCNQLLAQIDVAMGGRAAEELEFGLKNITGGAMSDLCKATEIGMFISFLEIFSENVKRRFYITCIISGFWTSVCRRQEGPQCLW